MGEDSPTKKNRLWAGFWAQPRARWLLGIPLGGFVAVIAGAVGLGVLNEVLHATSTNEFCYQCHSHE